MDRPRIKHILQFGAAIVLLLCPAFAAAQFAPFTVFGNGQQTALRVADNQLLASFNLQLLGGTHLFGGTHLGAILASSSSDSDAGPTLTLSGPSGDVLADLSQTLNATTSENATCGYATAPNTAFSSMTPFNTTGGTTHSTILWNVPDGSSVTYYVKCKDNTGNLSNEVSDSFSVQPFPLQTTLDLVTYYSTELPFKNLMFQSTPWASNNYGGTCNSSGITTDADGYPTSSLTGTYCNYHTWLVLDVPQGTSLPPNSQYPWPAGQYVLTYDGSGASEMQGLRLDAVE